MCKEPLRRSGLGRLCQDFDFFFTGTMSKQVHKPLFCSYQPQTELREQSVFSRQWSVKQSGAVNTDLAFTQPGWRALIQYLALLPVLRSSTSLEAVALLPFVICYFTPSWLLSCKTNYTLAPGIFIIGTQKLKDLWKDLGVLFIPSTRRSFVPCHAYFPSIYICHNIH